MAQSLLFEVVGESSLDRSHHRAFLAWREPQACLPNLMTPWRGTAPPWPPNPVPKNRKHLLLSAVRKPCPLDHSHLRGALPGGTQDPGLPKALPWGWPSNTGPFVSSGCSPPC